MAVKSTFFFLNFLCLLLFHCGHGMPYKKAADPLYKTYIIQLDRNHQKPSPFPTHTSWHKALLRTLSNPIVDHDQMFLYSYTHAMHGFSCRLTESQLAEIQETWPAHVATYPDASGRLLTTHTPEFLGLNHVSGLWPNSSYGEDVVVGVLDSGIWHSSESFHDQGMPAVPVRWKGQCEEEEEEEEEEERYAGEGRISYCNRKLIGSRSFLKGAKAAAATAGRSLGHNFKTYNCFSHGTHIASTAAGNFVQGASYSGYGKGTASGIAPRAHIAMYKVVACDSDGSISSVDVLAALDQAIADCVDIISLSIAVDVTPNFYLDPIYVSSLSAVEKGIFVAAAAGNSPSNGAIFNGAPWITTVGGGTIDRSFTARLVLSNGVEIEGYSYFQLDILGADVPLYYCQTALGCDGGSLNGSEVAGKMVLIDGVSSTEASGGVAPSLEKSGAFGGLIIVTNNDDPKAFLSPKDGYIPTIALSKESGDTVRRYIVGCQEAGSGSGGAKVQSVRFRLTKLGTKPAPQVASYSSRGPDPFNPNILKPDVLAPGHQILAAFSRQFPYTSFGQYSVTTDYGLMSGTSMAAPHVAGAAALLKSLHPEWTPAAIRSALMTTAYVVDNSGQMFTEQSTSLPMSPLDFGAGHIDLKKAMDPGLVYDIRTQDYVDFLCGQNFTTKQIDAILRYRGWKCGKKLEAEDLNYPSLTTVFAKGPRRSVTFHRVLTNAGEGRSVYNASLENPPPEMKIRVEPATLSFRRLNETKKFLVTLDVEEDSPRVVFCFMRWTDQNGHVVSSPIVALNRDAAFY